MECEWNKCDEEVTPITENAPIWFCSFEHRLEYDAEIHGEEEVFPHGRLGEK